MATETKSQQFFKDATNVGVSLVVLFATIWVISKAWKKGQK